MTVPEASSSKRKHITSACVPCRESKVKCDGIVPSCKSCQTKGKLCQYQAGDDKRKLSHRMVIEVLADRIDGLCQFIRQNSLEPPAMDGEKHTSLTKGLSHLRLSDTISDKDGFYVQRHQRSSLGSFSLVVPPGTSGPLPGRPEFRDDDIAEIDIGVSLSSDEGAEWRLSPRGGSEPELPLGSSLLNMPSTPSAQNGTQALGFGSLAEWAWPANCEIAPLNMISQASLGEIHVAHPTDAPPSLHTTDTADSTEELVGELSDRIGSLRIGPGGQVRYYGPTSNFNLVDMGAPDNLTVHRSVRDHGPDYLKRLDMGKDVPKWLEDHLISLYFAWQDPSFHVVKRDMYEKARHLWQDEKEDTPYFSESLQNSLCCLGAAFEARHHATFTTFPKSLSDFFADRAKTLLEIELDQPSVATVQALIILSSHDIGCKRDTRGWLYSGMATRLAFHLALHLDMTSYVASKSITKEEADLRRDVFWAGYTVDHIWSFHLGRAFRINMETVTVKLPEGDDVSQWVPYVSPKPLESLNPLPDHTVILHRQRVLLCEITGPIGFALYGNLGMAPSALHDLNKTTVSRLFQWKASLPEFLQVDEDNHDAKYLPHVLLLHMLYHQNIIYTHRPWMSRRTRDSQPHLKEGHNPEHARTMCIEAAISIAKLLQLYEMHWGLRRINIQAVGITCSAALLLIFAVVVKDSQSLGPTTSESNPAVYLGPCFRALDEFAISWESAKQARDFLTLLQRRWELQARKLVAKGSSQSPRSATDSTSNKRPRIDDSAMLNQRPYRPWTGTQQDVLAMDMNVDLEWMFMGGNSTPDNGWNPGSLDSLL